MMSFRIYIVCSCAVSPPGGSGWIISVGYYDADNSFAALESSNPREVRLRALARLLCFSFSICSSPFCFLLTEFHYTFSMSYKILPYYVY